MKLKKELRAVKEINEQERKKRDEPGANHHHHHDNLNHHDDHHDSDDRDAKKASFLKLFRLLGCRIRI